MSILPLQSVTIKDGERTLFSNLDLTLEAGERLVVFGPSGSGKLALLKTAAGILSPRTGNVSLDMGGRPLPVGYIAREGGLVANITLLQNVILPVVYHRILEPKIAETKAKTLLFDLGVREAAFQRPAAAPTSAKRMAQFARALLAEPSLYVIDSPFDDIDAAGASAARDVLKRIAQDSRACSIVATGSLKPYLDWGRRFLLIHDDQVRHFAGRDELLRDDDPELKVFLS